MTLIELIFSVLVAGLLALALMNVVETTVDSRVVATTRSDFARSADFALARIGEAVGQSERLILPLVDVPTTPQDESLRDPGVLAVTLSPDLDRDLDGIADADNDGDGRVDEDHGADAQSDGESGIAGVDDDADGTTDENGAGPENDDEGGTVRDEDPVNGLDDDGDGNIDEDAPADMNGDGAPGLAGVDDDGDGQVDEGSADDDDEDGLVDEDWMDVVVFRLEGTTLLERAPRVGATTPTDWVEHPIAENVQRFQVARMPRAGRRTDLVRIDLRLGVREESLDVSTAFRVGGRRP